MATGSGSDAGALPVPYAVPNLLALERADRHGSPPGANDWTRRPSADHPNPVVLVHSTSGNKQGNWQTLAPLLSNEGYTVFALTYGAVPHTPWPIDAIGGITSMKRSARQLAAFVDRVLDATGADKVDIVGHSQGALMPNYYVKFLGGAAKVDKYVSLAPLWGGTDLFVTIDLPRWLKGRRTSVVARRVLYGISKACQEMRPDSAFLRELARDGIYSDALTYTNIVTTLDQVVVPYTSGCVEGPNATTIVVQDEHPESNVNHLGLMADPIVARYVVDALAT
ncbi:esterase/lipase family protein [Antrihabitans cavernicola]|nr:alpha/beta fold hydrolase [Spelaeibacter cavernicola]